ncbi:KTSC domain-containing protein [Neorhizobium sp. P12A]|jgi:hypothetical protein|uniref:KTSC domain-containing protein n=1 Tax=Rhizobium/Agrobacterium group TaxID=227290 RepID=UPI001049D360|nr:MULTISPECIES: KTSC domain-containing protein [Rhizobium/Agrobacterium group]KAA0691436.1 KTSC domain-containing protein [Neorhizobium sp. P12A]TCR73193.1 KTSC domain-containing protein [Rhizobium sp. BK376]
MQTQSFHSEVVRSVTYDEHTETLTIYFTNSRNAAYFDVPPMVAEQLFNMPDPAEFVARFIASSYSPLQVGWKSIFRRRKAEIAPERTDDWLKEIGTLRYRRR